MRQPCTSVGEQQLVDVGQLRACKKCAGGACRGDVDDDEPLHKFRVLERQHHRDLSPHAVAQDRSPASGMPLDRDHTTADGKPVGDRGPVSLGTEEPVEDDQWRPRAVLTDGKIDSHEMIPNGPWHTRHRLLP